MRLGIVVSDLALERPIYTTITVALAAARAGHEVCVLDAADFSWGSELAVHARSAVPPAGNDPASAYLDALLAAPRRRLPVSTLDVLWLRGEPSLEPYTTPVVGMAMSLPFAQAAADAGVPTVSDPRALAAAVADKAYTLRLASAVRPGTLVSRDADELLAFLASLGGSAVLKPLHGAGGESVFHVRGPDDRNLAAVLEAVLRFGYVVAQEYVPAAEDGVIRLFLLDGEPFTVDGVVAAMRHMPRGGDLRSNFRVSGSIAPAGELGTALAVAEVVGPRFAADGFFIVALDIAGDRLLEANVFSPGGLRGIEQLTGAPFCAALVRALEAKAATLTLG